MPPPPLFEAALTVARGDFVVVVAHGPEGGLERVLPHSRGTPWAMTNPIWFE